VADTQTFKQRLAGVLRRDHKIYVVYGFLITSITLLFVAYGLIEEAKYFLYGSSFTVLSVVSLLTLIIGYFIKLIALRHPRPLTAMVQELHRLIRHPEEIIGFVLLLTATSFLFSAFTSLKSLIPDLNPFVFDEAFAALDRSLHFGVDPWVITHSLFSGPIATGVINLFYNLWFFLYWVVLFFFILRVSPKDERLQYMITHILSWFIIGGLLATLMSSAGPVYYGHFSDGASPFDPLMDVLRGHDVWLVHYLPWIKVWALDTQALLWNNYISGDPSLASGISAMPSMHVSMAVLMALAMGRINRIFAIFFWTFAIIIQIGSVHLAWHYAIDGYLAAILTIILWKLVGKWVKHL